MKDFIFTAVHDDIYLLETPRVAKEKYGEDLHFLHHEDESGYNFYYTLRWSSDLLWINIRNMSTKLVEHEISFLRGLATVWPYLKPNAMSEKSFPLEKITFFGGTFSPWHQGHATIVKRVRKSSSILVMPDKNPFKHNKKLARPLKAYVNFCKQLKKELNLGTKWIYPGFITLEEGNPTFEWIKQVTQNYPELEIHLALGYDSAFKIDKWYNADTLLKLIDGIYILSRKESDSDRQKLKDKIYKTNPDLLIEFLGHHPYEDLSSTQLRQQ